MNIRLYSNIETTILSALQRQGIVFSSSVCGGAGTCGKCKVEILSGPNKGIRLACRTRFVGNIEISIPDDAETLILGDYNEALPEPEKRIQNSYGLAVDIGTTTVVISLLDLSDGKVLDTEMRTNSQACVGADVISRIKYATDEENGTAVLHDLICGQLLSMIEDLLKRFAIDKDNVTSMTVAGNTTMLHLLVGENPRGIAVSPFTPVFLEPQYLSASQLNLTGLDKMNVVLIGGISSYVGADIVAGLHSTHIVEKDKPTFFLDIGTNGEMALFTGEELLCCSTAAGPVFEGSSIECGMPSIKGAISHVGKNGLQTIGDAEPIGLCGSAVIDTMAYLLKQGLVDETGFMKESFSFKRDFDCDVVFTPKDVREVQLAKSAIASGLQTLLNIAGLKEEDLDTIYLAGGFGTYLNPESAITIGLLPSCPQAEIISMGNTALRGATVLLLRPSEIAGIQSIRKRAKYIELSGRKDFNEFFIENMMFE